MVAFYPPRVTDGSADPETYWHEMARKTGEPDLARIGTPLSGDQACEIAVIGGGLAGLTAALELAVAGADVRLLESGELGWGASTRSGGLWGPHPSGLHLETLLKRYGPQVMRAYMDILRRATERMLAFTAAENVDIERTGGGFIEVAHNPQAFQRIARRAGLLENLLGVETAVYSPGEFAEVGFVSEEQCGAVLYRHGFGMNPLNLVAGLAQAAARSGAGLHPHSRVSAWESGEGVHTLHTEDGHVRARTVVLAANGYFDENLNRHFARRLLPVLSNVLVTRPLTDDELQEHAWSVDEPCFSTAPDAPFFRLLPDRRVLFGARGGVDGSPEDESRTREWLIWRMGDMFPVWKTFEVTHFWRGLTARTRGRTPAIGRLKEDPSVYYAFGYHGMGLAAAYWSGGLLARAITEGGDVFRRIPPPLRGPAGPWHWPDPRNGILRKKYRRDVM